VPEVAELLEQAATGESQGAEAPPALVSVLNVFTGIPLSRPGVLLRGQ